MLVRMLVPQAGVDFLREAGAVVEVDPAEAGRLIGRGYAEPVRQAGRERAVRAERTERAVR